MNHIQENCTSRRLINLLIAASLALPLPSLAASVALATSPLTTSSTSSVKPNLMFIIDDSGSMGWNYLPDWANDNHPTVGTNYTSMPELFSNSGFNSLAYNPAITYAPPVFYDPNGTQNTTAYPSQTGVSAATGASTAVGTPNWRAVKNDAYGVQSTSTSNLENSASYYVFVPGEYCSTEKMDQCVTASAPTTVAGVLYDKPAVLRWCNSASLNTCQSINNSTYKYPRYPGPSSPAKATLKVTFSDNSPLKTVAQITVNGKDIMSAAATGSTTESTTAKSIRDKINACTAAITGNCTVAGFSATVSSTTVTIIAPTGMGAISYTPSVTGAASTTVTAFSGYQSLPGSNLHTNIVSTVDSYPYPGSATKASTRTDCAGTTCTYEEEMTNYANWWTYYHTRLQAMKTSVSRAFKSLDSRFRVGYTAISSTNATDGPKFLSNGTFELAHKNKWFTTLFATDTSGSTPLRGALSKAGRYYGNKISGQTDPVQYSCQQNFTILSTDGYWNTGDESGSYTALDLKGNLVGDLDGGTTPLPMKQGVAASNTLADIAKYYYDTDLRTSALGNCTGGTSPDFPSGNSDVCTNEVYTSSTDNNIQQHMTTFTMGLGIDGTLNYTADYLTATSGDYYDLKNALNSVSWPDPITNSTGARIDDLWHAAVNGHGIYFSAKDPDQIVTGFNAALSSITAKLGSAAAAATSTLNPVSGNNFAYVASYTTVSWRGNLEARTINTSTGVVSASASWCAENVPATSCAAPGIVMVDTSGSSTVYNCVETGSTAATCAAPGVFDPLTSECKTQMQNACTGTMSAKVGTTSDTRNIYTANSAGSALVAFDAAYATANPANFSAAHINGLSQWGSLTAAQQSAAEGVNLINFLRGQTGFEDRASNAVSNRLYRAREATLGDALESQPSFISKPTFNFAYPGYSTFKSTHATRAGTVYMGTNDGMMHAFDAVTGVERWAYVPSMVIPNMWKLASANYKNEHSNYVNGSPITSDICVANCASDATAQWKTILVGGLNAGGRGYYALDITDPAAPSLLWEFTPTKDKDLGYSFGTPVITKKDDGTWVVLLTSGYDNGSQSSNPLVSNSPAGDGLGYLYVLNASSGSIISKISTGVGSAATPSGLAKIAAWNNEPTGIGNRAGFVYGGDLQGNLWRFDINSATTATVGNGEAILFATLFSDAAGTDPQPITTSPVLGQINNNRVVFIGTGKYLEVSDLSTTQVQSQYAIMDDNTATTLNNARTSLVKRTLINSSSTATRTTSTTACDGFSGRGWYVDFPDTKERVNIDAQLVQGTLLAPSIVPLSTACSPGGYGWLNIFDYQTGCAINNLSGIKYDSPIVGVNILYIEGHPIVEVVTSTNPTPEIPKKDGKPCDWQCFFKPGAGITFSGNRTNWRLMQ